MIHWPGTQLLVLGGGLTGYSLLEWGAYHGAQMRWMDESSTPSYASIIRDAHPHVPFHLGEFCLTWLDWADYIAVSPGIPFFRIPAAYRHKVVNDIELFSWTRPHYPIIGVTGSNGKTTTTELLTQLLRTQYPHVILCGNNNAPILSTVLESLQKGQRIDACVLELSSFQLYWTRHLCCTHAAILNITPDHINWHRDITHYRYSKCRLFSLTQQILLNADDPWLSQQTPTIPYQRFGHAGDHTGAISVCAHREGDQYDIVLDQADQPFLSISGYSQHQISNIMATIGLTRHMHLPPEAYHTLLKTFHWPAHRLMQVATIHGIQFYNDSKATNIGAATAALRAFAQERCCLILGGQSKGQDFTAFIQEALDPVVFVCLIGEATPLLAACLARHQPQLPVQQVSSLAQAVSVSYTQAQALSASIVLLSPACASKDMFHGHADRGAHFQQAVYDLQQSQTVRTEHR